ncbi:hypothetical protein AGLY_014010 [Aphis glycines]|uniref:Uncharacterized protein n=1 Tax=Aphis glycines TaxID=307491 RepID=A0A6G0T701_APHGL|nr:hypothetical protein AGLY_014010 [Aphis glycines]
MISSVLGIDVTSLYEIPVNKIVDWETNEVTLSQHSVKINLITTSKTYNIINISDEWQKNWNNKHVKPLKNIKFTKKIWKYPFVKKEIKKRKKIKSQTKFLLLKYKFDKTPVIIKISSNFYEISQNRKNLQYYDYGECSGKSLPLLYSIYYTKNNLNGQFSCLVNFLRKYVIFSFDFYNAPKIFTLPSEITLKIQEKLTLKEVNLERTDTQIKTCNVTKARFFQRKEKPWYQISTLFADGINRNFGRYMVVSIKCIIQYNSKTWDMDNGYDMLLHHTKWLIALSAMEPIKVETYSRLRNLTRTTAVEYK